MEDKFVTKCFTLFKLSILLLFLLISLNNKKKDYKKETSTNQTSMCLDPHLK